MDRARLRRLEAAMQSRREAVTWDEFKAASERIADGAMAKVAWAIMQAAERRGEPLPAEIGERLAGILDGPAHTPEQMEADHRTVERWRRRQGATANDAGERVEAHIKRLRDRMEAEGRRPDERSSLAEWFAWAMG